MRLGGLAAAGFAIGPLACKLMPKNKAVNNLPDTLQEFGLQLYTLRDVLLPDPVAILQQVASFGYKLIESYEGPRGMFWGLGHVEFKKRMDEFGLKLIASHCDINKDFQQKIDQAVAIGMKYLICPSIDAQKSIDDYKRFAEQFNLCGELCKKAGLKFAYHNHDYDFKVLEGQVVQDVYMQNTDPSLVDFEIDIYWAVTAGQDPVTWLNKYPNRFRLCHIKDRIKGSAEREASCDLGTGSINFAKIIPTAKKNGMQYYIAEQERYDGSTPMMSSKTGAEYLKKLMM